MAEIPGVKRAVGQGTVVVAWPGLAAGDTGAPVQMAGATDMVVQATGDATAVPVQGSNDGTNFAAFSTAVALNGSADEFAALPENTLFVQVAAITGGTATDVILVAKVRS